MLVLFSKKGNSSVHQITFNIKEKCEKYSIDLTNNLDMHVYIQNLKRKISPFKITGCSQNHMIQNEKEIQLNY